MLVSIMSILNLICPRPSEKVITDASQKTTDNDAMVADRPSSSSKKAEKKKKGFVNKLLNLFSSPPSDDSKSSDMEKLPLHKSRKEVKLKAPVDMDALRLFDYGPPKFGLSEATWTLLIMARKAVEGVEL